MYNLKKSLKLEQERLRRLKEQTEKNLCDAPEGKIRVGKSNGCDQFYIYRKNQKGSGTYISKKEEAIVRSLIQKSYDQKILRLAKKRLAQLDRILKDYEDNEIENIYLKQGSVRKKIITPVEQPFLLKRKEWLELAYEGKGFKEGMPEIITNSGIRVRSKSEKIMADYFDSIQIPYKYECPLYMKNYGIIYPDFTFLSRKTGEEIYWEHEGMMDNEEYAKAAVKKIELYQKNNIYPGERLILTFETSSTSLSTTILKEFTERYLL